MYLLMMDLLMGSAPEATQRFVPHWAPPQRELLIPSTPGCLTRPGWLSGCATWIPLSPGSRTLRSGREERAKHTPSILSMLRAAGAVPWKHKQNTKYLPEMISMPVSTILGKNLSLLPPEQSSICLKICFSAVFTSVILHFFLLLFYHFSRWLININSSPTTEKNHSSISLSYPELTGRRARNKWDGEKGQEITL